MINQEILETDLSKMLVHIATLRAMNPQGRGSGNPRGAQYTIKKDNPTFRPLVLMIELIAQQYNKPFKITDIWVNYSPPGCINGKHKHDDADIAGCWYLVVPENSGTIEWEHHDARLPNQFDFYYWDASLTHWVNENKSMQDRVSIAFNIKFL